ncbi:RHS repeat domain-containing protein [Flavivirga abyssicola]|uniref:RHS repeat domain-containing protein n=1 Tax=Flavivirga abyssicola TaxID=3063533 RepID=UPI0026DF9E3C|nr:RHS repeat domain-containing protein [Flavivirga sp. MEBiC07777]WVK12878.1 RHS repeat domain-containing protein [Flavivirga sp. MEBiC07777]
MNARFISFFIVLLGFSNTLLAQLSNPVTIPPSPQSEAFMKYGDYSVNYSTGVPNISVPLYEISHHGYKIPVSLSYYHQGLKPGYNVDVFGLGWGLNPTGKISREIRYKPDEFDDFVIEPVDLYVESYDSALGIYSNPRSTNISADLFHVSLPNGLSFDFTMGKINGNYQLSVSEGEPVIINCIDPPSGAIYDRTWEIIDKDGVKYTFLSTDAEKVFYGANAGTISTWNLSRIDLPNSDEPITYTYRPGVKNLFNVPNDTKVLSKWPVGCGDSEIPIVLDYNVDFLSRVSYGNSYIDFIYETPVNNTSNPYTNHNFIKSVNFGELNGALVKKVTFNMSDHGNRIPYSYTNLMLLDSVDIIGSSTTLPPKKYKFTYDNLTTFGPTFTDHWGYLNNREGESGTSGRLPGFYIYLHTDVSDTCLEGGAIKNTIGYDLAEYKIGNANRDPGGGHGLLKKITYPTGGYTEFTFERNAFKRLTPSDHTVLNSFTLGGGFRIGQIANYTSENILASRKIYRYGEIDTNYHYYNYGPKHTGLGIAPVEPNALSYLNYTRRYVSYIMEDHEFLKYDPTNGQARISVIPLSPVALTGFEHSFSSAQFRSILNGRPPVIYPEVTVYTGEFPNSVSPTLDETLGKTVYKYDYLDYGNFIEPWNFRMGGGSYYVPKKYRYNRLIEQTHYKREDKDIGQGMQSVYVPIKKIENTWEYIPAGGVTTQTKLLKLHPNTSYTPDGHPMTYYFEDHKINEEYVIPRIRESITTEYTNGSSIQTKENMRYDGNGFLIEREVENSNGKKTIQYYKYPNSLTGQDITPIIETMKNDTTHIISPVIESSTRVKEGLTETFISGTKTDYKEFTIDGNTLIMPEKQIQIDNLNIETTESTILSYTANGKPREVLKKDGLRTSYLWGYKDRYLVAKVDNASIGSIESALTAIELTNIKNGTYDRSTMISKLNKIRNSLPSSMVATYTYDPLIGITSMTKPNGETTYYEYDEFGRLEKVKDKDDYLLNETEYNYKQ